MVQVTLIFLCTLDMSTAICVGMLFTFANIMWS